MDFIAEHDAINFCMVKIGDHTFVLEECNDFAKGLSKREHLLDNEGMLFNFPTRGIRSFHMKDCLVPLDIIFIDKGIVKKIHHNCSPCESDDCKKYECNMSDIVVEVLGGTCKKNNINEGLIFRHF
jgi:uncharacterized membrane protein (UPF0127 family)